MARPVYAILVNLDRWRDTIECAESILASDYPDTRVIIVDNASRDDSVARIAAWSSSGTRTTVLSADDTTAGQKLTRVTLISSARNVGFAAGNNIALRLVTATEQPAFVWLVNNDMVVDAQALSEMVATLGTGNGVGAVGGVILDYTDRDLVQSIGGGRMTKLGMGRVFGAGLRRGGITPPPALDYISGGHLLTRTETIREVGLLDERYFLYAEDADWGARMRERGYELACALNSFVWHKGSITIVARSPFQDYHITRSHLSYVRRNAPLLLPVAATYSLIRFLAPKLIRGEWRRARAVIAAYRDHVAARNSSDQRSTWA